MCLFYLLSLLVLILECQYFSKEVILTPTAKALLPGNLGLLTRLQDAKIL